VTQLPAYLQSRAAPKLAENLASHLGAGTPPYVSIAGNRLTLVDATGAEEPVATYDPKTGPYLDCVIVDALDRISKIYYDKAFDPSAGQYEPPACWSDNGVTASRNASRPQNGPTFRCDTCPNAVWGSKVSAVSGKGVKACSDQQKLAIMVPGDDVVFLLRVPPNSLSQLRGYIGKFNGQAADVSDVLTRISFEPQGIGTLKFDAISYIDEESYKRREALRTAKATDGLVGRTDLPREAALPPPAAVAQIAAQPAPEQGHPAPFVPAGAPPAALPSTPAPQAAPAAPTAEQPAPRRRRRTQAEMAAAQPQAPAAAPQGAPAPAMAPFRPEAQAQQPPPANASFGIQQPAGQVPDQIGSMLDSLFKPGA